MSPLSNFEDAPSGSVNPSVPDAIQVVYFTPYERKGVIVMAVAGVVSCTFVSLLLLAILFSALSPWTKPKPGAPTPFIRKQIAVFVICLLVSDLIQSISGIIQVKWASERKISEGGSCTTQAAMMVMGDLASTVWSCVVAAHTFSGLALGKQWPRWVVFMTVFTGWTFVIVLTLIGPLTLATNTKGAFFGIAGMWCFIKSEYAIARLGLHYVPLFFAAIVIFGFYGLIFLVLRGRISFTRHVHLSPIRMQDQFSRERVIIAKRMLWYPVAYLTCILPIAIIRLVGLTQDNVPDGVWIFGMFFLFSLGAIDSVIYATTRTLIKPFSFPTHMRTFSDRSSSKSVKTATSQKKSTSDPIDSDLFKDTDKYSYRPEETAEDNGDGTSTPKADTYQETRPGVIHVTLERIQEVI